MDKSLTDTLESPDDELSDIFGHRDIGSETPDTE